MRDDSDSRYQCPGESYTISRADHLARLAGFYAKCSDCPHRADTGPLSPRLLARIDQAHQAVQRPASLLLTEGVGGVAWNEFTPALARDWARALGLHLRDACEQPTVLLAGDGRQISPEFVAAAAEGLRWAGCQVIDLGTATAPALAASVARLPADGGLLVANPLGGLSGVGLKFWSAGGCPLSKGGTLDAVAARLAAGLDRPVRRAAGARRGTVDPTYLAAFEESFHALRPLRIAVDTACQPFVSVLTRLLAATACELVTARLPAPQDAAHLGIQVDADAEACRVFDEQSRELPLAALTDLLSTRIAGGSPDTPVPPAPPRTCEEQHRQMQASRASFAVAGEGRYWFAGNPPAPDALWVLAQLLGVLSESDRPLSEVWEGAAPRNEAPRLPKLPRAL